jgi:hypothetical protein
MRLVAYFHNAKEFPRDMTAAAALEPRKSRAGIPGMWAATTYIALLTPDMPNVALDRWGYRDSFKTCSEYFETLAAGHGQLC